MTKKLNDLIDPKLKFELVESSEVDGKNILAKVKGQFFCPDANSRNGRFYPKELWEKVISSPNVQRMLKKRLMWGTVGHDAELGEKAIREGITSHVMTSIFIDDQNRGMGEALILDTPVGRILNTLLRAGCELYVSSRANGDFAGKHNGVPVVNPQTYDLVGWDFVIDPGFLDANPTIAESYNSALSKLEESENNLGDTKMEKELVEHIMKENNSQKTDIAKLTTEVVDLKENNGALFDENKHLKEQLSTFEEVSAKLKKYEEMGEPEDVEKALELGDEAADELEKYKSMGSPDEVKESLTKAKNYIAKFHANIGTYKVVESALIKAKKFQESVAEIGTISEIKGICKRFNVLLEEVEQTEQDQIASDLAAKLEIDVEKVKELLAKDLSVEDIEKMYATVEEKFKKAAPAPAPKNESKPTDKYKKPAVTEAKKETEEKPYESKIVGRTLVDKLNESYGTK